jgi:hypothetical protein
MRFIPRKYHAILDYIYGFLLMFAPWLIGFSQYETPTHLVYLWGLLVVLLSLNTDYEGGASKVVTMSLHLRLDVIGGLLLAASPWLFGFYTQTFIFHLAAGTVSVMAGLFTINKSEHPNSKHVDDMMQIR